jgi:hypothetical protein
LISTQPLGADYVELLDGGVRVIFRPTASEFTYQLLADPDNITRGPLSRLSRAPACLKFYGHGREDMVALPLRVRGIDTPRRDSAVAARASAGLVS